MKHRESECSLPEISITEIQQEYNTCVAVLNKLESKFVLVIFTNKKLPNNLQLPSNTLLISKEKFSDYFSPTWANRARLDYDCTINVNTSDWNVLQLVKGVGPYHELYKNV